MDRIEFEPAAFTTCNCCPGITTHLTRFVSNASGTIAAYLIKFSPAHPGEAKAIVAIGDWSDTAGAEARREAFAFRLNQLGTAFNMAVIDAADSPWADAPLLGRKLTRAEALAHPQLPAVHAITGAMVEHDAPLKAFFGVTA